MKFYIAIILMFANLASTCMLYVDKERLDRDKYNKECIEELKIPDSDVEKYYKYKASLPDDTAMGHCYTKCFFEKIGIFDEDNGFNVKYMYNKMAGGSDADPSGDFLVAIQECAKEALEHKEISACERAYIGAKCFISESFFESQKKYLHLI